MCPPGLLAALLLLSVCPCLSSLLDDLQEVVQALGVDGDAVEGALNRVARLVGSQCVYTCPDGRKPVPNPAYRPTTNGCGSFGFQIESRELPAMTSCCDDHDICYDTCNAGRENCDTAFYTCLHAMCSNIQLSVTHRQYITCKDTVDLMYTGTLALGCSPYLASQAAACSCGQPPLAHHPAPSRRRGGYSTDHNGADDRHSAKNSDTHTSHRRDPSSREEESRYTSGGGGHRQASLNDAGKHGGRHTGTHHKQPQLNDEL